jgi:hypothetical protein
VITFDSAIIQTPPQKIKVFSGGVQQSFFESRFSGWLWVARYAHGSATPDSPGLSGK